MEPSCSVIKIVPSVLNTNNTAPHVVNIKSCSVNFSEFKCNFLSRVGNRAAHALATLGSECVEGEALITSYVPRDVHVIVADDLSDK